MKQWRFLLSLDHGWRKWTLAGVALALAAAASSVALVATAGWLITASALAGLAAAGGAAITLEIFAPGALIRAFAVLRTATRYGERLLVHEALFRVMARLRRRIFSGAAAAPYNQLVARRRSDTLTRLLGDVETLENFHPGLLIPLLAATGASGLLVIIAAFVLPPLFILLAAIPGIAGLLACFAAATMQRRYHFRAERQRDRLRRELPDMLGAHRELYFSDSRQHTLRHWLTRDGQLSSHTLRQKWLASLAETLPMLALAAALIGLLLASTTLLQTGSERAPQLALLTLGLIATTGLWSTLPGAWQTLSAMFSASRRIAPEIANPTSVPARRPEHRESPPQATGWELRNVSLRQGISGQPLFSGLNLTIPAGSKVCITGASGSGKSTLARLLCGLQQPDTGEVLLNGRPVHHKPESERFQHISYMPQETTIISGTLRDNLRLANPSLSDNELRQALESIGLKDMQHRLDTWIGLNGWQLSGGEARRVALLRAFLAPSTTLILDEPLRGLDTQQGSIVLRLITQSPATRTVIVLNHDRPALQGVDVHLALDR